MSKQLFNFTMFIFFGWNVTFGQPASIWSLDASTSKAKIQPTMYGIFFEDINFAADGGLYAEMVKNRGFEFDDPMLGWSQPNSDRHSLNTKSGIASIFKNENNAANRNFCRIFINDASNYVLINEGFKGMGIVKDETYHLSFDARIISGDIKRVNFEFIDKDGKGLGKGSADISGKVMSTYSVILRPTVTEMKAQLKVTFVGNGTIDIDMISLFPEDTWKGRKRGLRKDIVQLLADLKPGFLRFPGGCIVEGRTLAERYQWKKTVGPIEKRETLINRWNLEFKHRPAPDYYQSFGLGFFEYFQLSEDIGAEPLPILGCGMACQFNTGELVPLDQMDPYVQDALDLIEFANGGLETEYGKIRAEMGHPEPFNLKYLGIGNEQWGPEYFSRYLIIEKAIRGKYPNIVIVSGSGPFPDGEHFDFGWGKLKDYKAEIVDEHYYRPPSWFRENADRYDNYDRKGPKIFAGEYAAQSVAIASPNNKNNWECALSEAAFMTGLERNADIVYMTSYAPLMAHAEGWQWTPDLIWFNNLDAYATPNYHVQKLYSNNAGTDLLSITSAGVPIKGQDDLFASAVRDSKTNELMIKVANTSQVSKSFDIQIKGQKLSGEGEKITLSGSSENVVNSFDKPDNISPVSTKITTKKDRISETIEAGTFMVLKLKIK